MVVGTLGDGATAVEAVGGESVAAGGAEALLVVALPPHATASAATTTANTVPFTTNSLQYGKSPLSYDSLSKSYY